MLWEQRWHLLREKWVIVAAHRQNRPWIGETVRPQSEDLPQLFLTVIYVQEISAPVGSIRGWCLSYAHA